MRGGRWWSLAVLTVAAGCLWSRKPYADDPLARRRPAPRGEPVAAPIARPTPPGPTRVHGVDSP